MSEMVEIKKSAINTVLKTAGKFLTSLSSCPSVLGYPEPADCTKIDCDLCKRQAPKRLLNDEWHDKKEQKFWEEYHGR